MNRVMRAVNVLLGRDTSSQKYYGNTLLPSYGSAHNWLGAQSRDLQRNTFGASLAYMYVPVVRQAVDVLAEAANNVPLVIHDARGNEIARSDDADKQHDLLRLIANSEAYCAHPLLELWMRSRLLWGASYIEKVRNPRTSYGGGVVRGLKWLNGNGVNIHIANGDIMAFHYTESHGTYTKLDPDDVLYTRTFNPLDDLEGYGVTLTALAKVNHEIHFDKFVASYMNNGGQPGFAIMPKDGAITVKQARELRDFWRENMKGVENFFKTYIGTHPAELQAFEPVDISKSQPMADSTRRQILSAYRVSPEMVGDTQDNAYQYSDQTYNVFMTQSVRPVLTPILNALNNDRDLRRSNVLREGETIHADFSPFENVSENELKAQDIAQRRFQSGGISFNEYRREINQPTVDEARDFFYLPTGGAVVPIAQLGQPLPQAEPSPAPLPAPPEIPARAAEFSRYTYNGVTCQATGRRTSSRDDKKYERTVRYDGSERTVHYGDPDMEMQRDDEEARENFLARHSCDEKTDPFAAGFWACYDWKNTDEKAYRAIANENEAFAYIPAGDEASVVAVQREVKRQLRQQLSDDAYAAIEWQSVPTLHITLCYSPSMSDSQIDSVAQGINVQNMEIRGRELDVFENADSRALHIVVDKHPSLTGVQRYVYDEFTEHRVELSPYSIPDKFNPHITLAYLPGGIDAPTIDFDLDFVADTVILGRDDYDPYAIIKVPVEYRASTPTLADMRALANKHGIELADTLRYYEEFTACA